MARIQRIFRGYFSRVWGLNPALTAASKAEPKDKLQISTTFMQVMIMVAEFSQVSAAQLSALWEGIYNIMPSDI